MLCLIKAVLPHPESISWWSLHTPVSGDPPASTSISLLCPVLCEFQDSNSGLYHVWQTFCPSHTWHMDVFPACTSVHHLGTWWEEKEKRRRIPWNWSWRRLQAAVCVQETEPRSSWRRDRALQSLSCLSSPIKMLVIYYLSDTAGWISSRNRKSHFFQLRIYLFWPQLILCILCILIHKI